MYHANKLYETKDYKMSTDLYSKAFKIESNNPNHLYNGACASSLAGNTTKAFKWLNLYIENGFRKSSFKKRMGKNN